MTKFRAVVKRRWLILVVTCLIGAVAALIAPSSPNQASSQEFVAKQTLVTKVNASVNVTRDVLKMTRGDVPKIAAETLEFEGNPDSLARQIESSADTGEGSITISTSDLDPEVASLRVQAFVDAFLEDVRSDISGDLTIEREAQQTTLERIQAEMEEFDDTYPEFTRPGFEVPANDPFYNTLLESRNDLLAKERLAKEEIRSLDSQIANIDVYTSLGVETPTRASSSLVEVPQSKKVRAVLLGAIGLLLGALAVVLIERFSKVIDTRDELVEATDIPILAEVGFIPARKRSLDDSGQIDLAGPWAEPYRRVRSAIQFVQADGDNARGAHASTEAPINPATFLVTSSSPSEGKSTTSALVAIALAEVGNPTLLIGGDFRKPKVDTLLGISRSPSLQDLSQLDLQRVDIDDVVRPSRFPNLYVVSAGEPTREVSRLVKAARDVAEEATQRGATVIIDSSPLQAANDSLDLLPVVDYVILTIRAGSSRVRDLQDTIETLKRMDSKILGAVLIGTSSQRRQEYYYEYYSGSDTDKA